MPNTPFPNLSCADATRTPASRRQCSASGSSLGLALHWCQPDLLDVEGAAAVAPRLADRGFAFLADLVVAKAAGAEIREQYRQN